MNSVLGSAIPPGDATSRVGIPEVSLLRLYALRVPYLLMAVGLGVGIWPIVLHHTNEFAITDGIRIGLLAGISATALLGLRYPLQMLPLLLFELIWKAIYLIAFALPLWSAHQISAAAEKNILACLAAVIFVPLIPWRYVFAQYVLKPGDRWK
jgi:hypothetical protein